MNEAAPSPPGADDAAPADALHLYVQIHSMADLRAAHSTLLQRKRAQQKPGPEAIQYFLNKASELGVTLSDIDERESAQGILDYWTAELLKVQPEAAARPASFTLAEYDKVKMGPFAKAARTQSAAAESTLTDVLKSAEKLPSLRTPEGRRALRKLLLHMVHLKEGSLDVFTVPLPEDAEILRDERSDVRAALKELQDAGLVRKALPAGEGGAGGWTLAFAELTVKWPLLQELLTERRAFREKARGWAHGGRDNSALLHGGDKLAAARDYQDLRSSSWEKEFLQRSQDQTEEYKKSELSRARRAVSVLSVLLIAVAIMGFVAYRQMKERERAALSEKDALARLVDINKQKEAAIGEKALALDKLDKVNKEKAELQERANQEKAAALAAKEAELDAKSAKIAAANDQILKAEQELKLREQQLDLDAKLRENIVNSNIVLSDKLEKILLGKGINPANHKELTEVTNQLRGSSVLANAAQDAGQLQSVINDVKGDRKVDKEAAPTRVARYTGHKSPITCLAFLPDGTLVSGSEDERVRFSQGDDESTKYKLQRKFQHGVRSLAVSPTGSLLAIGSNGSSAVVFDWSNNTIKADISKQRNMITSISFHPGGKRILTSSADQSVLECNPLNIEDQPFFADKLGANVSWVSYDREGKRAVASLDEGGDAALLWNLAEGPGSVKKMKVGAPVKRAAFSPAGDLVVTADFGNNTATLWDAATGERRHPPLKGHTGSVWRAEFHPTQPVVATGSADGTIKIWNVNDGKLVRTLTGHQGDVRYLEYSPDGKVLLSGSSDTTAKLWYGEETTARHTLFGHGRRITVIKFNKEGDRIATGSQDNTVQLYDFKPAAEAVAASTKKGWCYYGTLEKSKDPGNPAQHLLSQSFAPVPRDGAPAPERNAVPKVGDIVRAEAYMNMRDSFTKAEKGWQQGKAVDFVLAGDRLKVLKVETVDQNGVPTFIWIEGEYVPPPPGATAP